MNITKKVLNLILLICIGAFCFLSMGAIQTYTQEKTVSNQPNKVNQEANWGKNTLNIEEIHNNEHLSGKNISIAILDTGIDVNHEDLEIQGGVSYISDTSPYEDDNGHGTHIAGIINAKNNNIGVSGVAPGSSIYSVKVLDKKRSGSYDNVVKGINWSIDHHMDIVVMSLGGMKESEELSKAVKKAKNAGIVLVSAAGNYGFTNKDFITYPAKYSEVISVGSIDKNNKRWLNSSMGKDLDVMAPGVDILSTSPNDEYSQMDGTSMSAAYVAGAVALLLEKEPSLTPQEVKDLLKSNCIPLGDKFEYGSGLIDIVSSISEINKKRVHKT